jgi:hypothetical protein
VAIGRFKKALAVYPDDMAAQLYLQRAAGWVVKGTPQDWDGAEVLSSK